ncbi:interferon omega-2-like [Talpa occidentalis]|uniref:interferon omega-2-like n=1 Tax=Talpa occidentalis TaxID=50954 RepID=UPI00188F2E65|nr:interferon omega-2-like [Talpa occidentalis]
MALLLSLLAALAVLSCCPGGSLACDLPPSHAALSRSNFALLGEMRRISPFLCLKDRKDFSFPWEALDGSLLPKAQAVSVLQEMLWETVHLFLSEDSSAAWNATLLDRLLSGLYRQLQALDACSVEEVREEDSALSIEASVLAVKSYFQGIHLYLQEKKYSDCAWEVVRVEIRRCFSLSTLLQERLSTKNGDLGSP